MKHKGYAYLAMGIVSVILIVTLSIFYYSNNDLMKLVVIPLIVPAYIGFRNGVNLIKHGIMD